MKRPRYRIVSQFADGSSGEEELLDLELVDGQWQVSRRNIISGAGALAAMAALAGCAPRRTYRPFVYQPPVAAQKAKPVQETKEKRIKLPAGGGFEEKTLACEAALPAGAICVCNCVPISQPTPRPSPDNEKKAADSSKEIKVKEWNDRFGYFETKTLPCGSPIPPGAICTCNCVPVVRSAPTVPTYNTYRTCTCVPVCTCNKVCTCIPIV